MLQNSNASANFTSLQSRPENVTELEALAPEFAKLKKDFLFGDFRK